MTIDRELWRRARPLFEELVQLESGPRRVRLAGIGGDDPALGAAVERLLLADSDAEAALQRYDFGARLAAEAHGAGSRDPLGVVGRTVSHFRITDYLAAGGMGVVYTAVDLQLGRTVALKFPLPHQRMDESVKQRFANEARSVAALDHPNLCTIHETGESEHGVFLAMPLYPGETLKERLARRGALPLEEALGIAGQIASGLASAHAVGIVHRDLKPGNVMLLPDGGVKVLDFGLAKVRDVSLTKPHAALGTIRYIAPEQIRDDPVDARTDLWALGVMLHEMLTGVPPFQGDHEVSILHAVLHKDPPRASALNLGLPAAVDGLTGALLQKRPGDRYPSADSLLADLDALKRGESIARRARSRKVPGRTTLLLAAVAAVAAVGVGSTWHPASTPPSAAAASVAVLPFTNAGGGSENDYVADGLADELTGTLGTVDGLRVAARASTVALEARGIGARALAESLGVDALLQGSVLRSGDRLTIEARLVNRRGGPPLWSQTFRRDVGDVALVQADIARAVAAALKVPAPADGGPSPVRSTRDREAYDLYLRGRHSWRTRSRQGLEQAVLYYEQAVERDPTFAAAHSALAEAYVNLGNFGYLPPQESLTRAKLAAERAVQLDPRAAEAYASLGFVLASERDFTGSEAAFRQSIALNPNYSWARHYYTLLLLMLDRTTDAAEQNRQALALDPLMLPARATRGIILAQRGDYPAANRELQSALTLAPEFPLTLFYLGVVKAGMGADTAALPLLERAGRRAPGFTGVPGALAYLYGRHGRQRAADSIISDLQARGEDDRVRTNLALAYAALGRRDEAFALFEQLRWDVPALIELRADPLLAAVRADGRYVALIARLGDESGGRRREAGGGEREP